MSVTLRDVVLPLAEFALEVDEELPARTTALCGPSGAGKTSLLEIIAGLRHPQRGTVRIGERTLFEATSHVDVAPRLRRVGYVPQDDALFPHLSARENVEYGARDDVGHIEDILEITSLGSRSVKKLSGGERKRVALARALVSDPEILLLDEPLAGVHAGLRGRVIEYLVRVRDEFAIPIILVTHDVAEAELLCEEIVMMDRGRIAARRRIIRSQ